MRVYWVPEKNPFSVRRSRLVASFSAACTVFQQMSHDSLIDLRTRAMAGLLLMLVFWTVGTWVYREHWRTTDQGLPADLTIDVNEATYAELNLLPGVGEKLAREILRYRTEHGRFESLEDLTKIPGIKGGRMIAWKKHVTLGHRSSEQTRAAESP